MKLRERFGQPSPDWVNDSDRPFGSGEAGRLERPAACPFCNATIIDTLATVITPTTVLAVSHLRCHVDHRKPRRILTPSVSS